MQTRDKRQFSSLLQNTGYNSWPTLLLLLNQPSFLHPTPRHILVFFFFFFFFKNPPLGFRAPFLSPIVEIVCRRVFCGGT